MDLERQLLNGDEAVALAALHAGVALGTGYPGTPSTEILEYPRLVWAAAPSGRPTRRWPWKSASASPSPAAAPW
jgi:TPP-dependent indolepyruvate ferredoxin oxidoreductase alpha subunit